MFSLWQYYKDCFTEHNKHAWCMRAIRRLKRNVQRATMRHATCNMHPQLAACNNPLQTPPTCLTWCAWANECNFISSSSGCEIVRFFALHTECYYTRPSNEDFRRPNNIRHPQTHLIRISIAFTCLKWRRSSTFHALVRWYKSTVAFVLTFILYRFMYA